MHLHIKLSKTTKLLNSCYSLQLLMLILVCFLGIVTSLYMLGINFLLVTSIEKKTENNLTLITWVFTAGIALMSVVYSTTWMCAEVINY